MAGPARATAAALDPNVLDRFLALNRARLRRARESVTPRQRDFLDLLPLAFHWNHPTLPGYVSMSTPAGIHDYAPSDREVALAQRFARAFTPKRGLLPRHEIAGLYLMGSAGSIGYAQGSDFDIWLCPNPGLDAARLAELVEKSHRIERWAAELGLDVHFFVFDAPSFRAGRTLSLSAESSGSTQRYLLLDEFYRSGLVLAGCSPLWWLVPPEHESDYDVYAQELIRRRFIGARECIDFGGVARVPAEEFFGATVWQIYKSIQSPYKSVLKLLLMEVYANEYQRIELLSLRYKRMVYDGVKDLNALDPYVLMYQKIEDYLIAIGDAPRLDLLRRCFYLKADDRLSRPGSDEALEWRRTLLQELAHRWGWDQARLILLDARANWRLETVLGERRDLVSALTQSYRFISQFAREQADSAHISQSDLTVLGRRLYAAFERKSGKIELVNRGIGASLAEPRLTLIEQALERDSVGWSLYRDHVSPADATNHSPLKRARSAAEILAWSHINQILTAETRLVVHTRDSDLNVREVRQILAAFADWLARGAGADAGLADLQTAPTLRSAVVFVNLGTQPLRERLRADEHLTTNATDALRYGARRHNLTLEFDLGIANSWSELFTYHYGGAEGLAACLTEWLRWALKLPHAKPPTIYCFNPGYAPAIIARVATLFRDAHATLAGQPSHARRRFLIEIDSRYHAVEFDGTAVTHLPFDSRTGLMRHLERGHALFCSTRIDSGTLAEHPLSAILPANRRDVIQVFVHERPERVEVFVLDEQGSLFHQRIGREEPQLVLEHYARLLDRVRSRLSATVGAQRRIEAEYHRVVPTTNGWQLHLAQIPEAAAARYFDVQAIGDVDAGGAMRFTLYCDGQEFSSLDHGEAVFEVAAAHILERRLSGLRYPIYITDLDLSPRLLARRPTETLQTVSLLRHKRTIEARLNRLVHERSRTETH